MKLYVVRYTKPNGLRGTWSPLESLPSAAAAMQLAREELPKGCVVTSAYESPANKRRRK